MNLKRLKSIHNHTYILTLPDNIERQKQISKYFSEIDADLFYGINKKDVSKETLIAEGIYNKKKAMEIDRSSRDMTLGHICCSLGHRMIYQDMLDCGYEKVLVFEDDAIPLDINDEIVEQMIAEIPADADLIYWGWMGGEKVPPFATVKQNIYKLQHSVGTLIYNHKMIDNLYSRPYNQYFRKAGKHFCAHAYTINRHAAQKLIEWQTPIVLNADNALMYAVLNGDIKAYIALPKLFAQGSIEDRKHFECLTAD